MEKLFVNPDNPNSLELGRAPLSESVVEVFGMSEKSRVSIRMITDSEGIFETTIEPAMDYKVTASKRNYFKNSTIVSSKNKQEAGKDTIVVSVELLLDKIYKKREIVLENIYYDLDKADIRPDARPTLDKLAQLLMENPTIKIELASHTDSRGTDSYNQQLSQRRAQSVVNYLISKNIDSRRLIAKGYGEQRLINECKNGVECSEAAHQENRRTTFQVIDANFSSGGIDFR